MKYSFWILCLFFFGACKNDKTIKIDTTGMSPVDIINNTKITPTLVDSLKENRIDKLTDLRKNVGFNCGGDVLSNFLYFKIKIDSNGKYSDVEVRGKDGIDHLSIQECIEKYLANNSDIDLGIIREMPDSKYGAIPRVKSYTLRAF